MKSSSNIKAIIHEFKFYGYIKDLARSFNVSESTVKRKLNDGNSEYVNKLIAMANAAKLVERDLLLHLKEHKILLNQLISIKSSIDDLENSNNPLIDKTCISPEPNNENE